MNSPAWIALSRTEKDAVWDQVYQRLAFAPGVDERTFPGFSEQAPSVTFSFKHIWGAGFSKLEADLQKNALAMFKMATEADDFLYAMDWQHQCYKVFPHRQDSPNLEKWMIPALPNGDYYLFLEKSLDFGWLGHPWEQTICIYGRPLLSALKCHRLNAFHSPIRRRDTDF